MFNNESDTVTTTASNTLVENNSMPAPAPIIRDEAPPIQNQQNLISNQKAYLELSNNYEIAKMKRKLLQEELAIANTRYEIGVLNHKFQTLDGSDHRPTTADSRQKSIDDLRLVYLDFQNGSWSATLANGNQFQQVNVGAQLPDGSYVMTINNRGVIMQRGNYRYNVNFNGITPLTPLQEQKSLEQNSNLSHATLDAGENQNLEMTKAERVEPAVPINEIKPAFNPVPENTTKTDANKSVSSCPAGNCSTVKLQFTELNNTGQTQQSELVKAMLPLTASNKSSPPSVKEVEIHPSLNAIPRATLAAEALENPNTKHSLDETVLLELPAYSYTIQLRASNNQKELIEFAKKNHIDDRTLCYANTNHKQPYYTLVYGDYLTTRAAESAMSDLPSNLRVEHVAIRSLSQIQREINR
jgi:septal ring-binding cell division protein DamX